MTAVKRRSPAAPLHSDGLAREFHPHSPVDCGPNLLTRPAQIPFRSLAPMSIPRRRLENNPGGVLIKRLPRARGSCRAQMRLMRSSVLLERLKRPHPPQAVPLPRARGRPFTDRPFQRSPPRGGCRLWSAVRRALRRRRERPALRANAAGRACRAHRGRKARQNSRPPAQR